MFIFIMLISISLSSSFYTSLLVRLSFLLKFYWLKGTDTPAAISDIIWRYILADNFTCCLSTFHSCLLAILFCLLSTTQHHVCASASSSFLSASLSSLLSSFNLKVIYFSICSCLCMDSMKIIKDIVNDEQKLSLRLCHCP